MDTFGRPQHQPILIMLAVLILACLGVLALYWSVAPEPIEPTYHIIATLIFFYLVVWGVIFLYSPASRTEKANRFLLTSVMLVSTISTLELLVAVRVLDFRTILNTPIKEPTRRPDNLLDPKLLYIPKPHTRSAWQHIQYRHDQNGFRNETDFDAADTIVLGDSFIWGPHVAANDLMTAHLARELHRTVVNLGLPSYGPQQELEVLRRIGLGFRPQTCVWNFYEGNDLGDVLRYQEATKDWESYSKEFHSFKERSFSKNAVLAVGRVSESIFDGGRDQADIHEDMSGLFKKTDGSKIRMYFVEPGRFLSRGEMEALKQVRASLTEAYELCHTINARFVVVFTPTKFRVYRDFTEFGAKTQTRYWVANNLPQEIQAIVHENLPGAAFLDLTSVFVEYAKKGSLVYFPEYDTHWSPEGHRVAASAIGNVITQWKLAGNSTRSP